MKQAEGISEALGWVHGVGPPHIHGLELHVVLQEELIHQGGCCWVVDKVRQDGILCAMIVDVKLEGDKVGWLGNGLEDAHLCSGNSNQA